ncbi:unnamed protein product [Sphenostylis stenocarpa]|uniref:Uncharacterized protein n=1 Tax=Sphenostylis stenocarpa TaxID=92480 RepID=A0AA86RW96_9FABA|nr:unnamed protein product [Sphenostylis stenocarpa]
MDRLKLRPKHLYQRTLKIFAYVLSKKDNFDPQKVGVSLIDAPSAKAYTECSKSSLESLRGISGVSESCRVKGCQKAPTLLKIYIKLALKVSPVIGQLKDVVTTHKTRKSRESKKPSRRSDRAPSSGRRRQMATPLGKPRELIPFSDGLAKG